MLNLSVEQQQAITGRFVRVMAELPAKKQTVEARLAHCDRTTALCLQFLYGFLPLSDVLTFEPEQLEDYVTAALHAREALPYGPAVPAELFLNYVLMPRVNNEHLDGSRSLLQAALWERVHNKSMTAAALEVNYWCCQRVTYHPSDDRTLGPVAVMRSTLGRCGEESTFAVSALRSVGIPARQCYVPRWSHCDDNHAWVELWAEGDWHYLGACEPEPVLDKGWFTAAASRAMVVHSRTLSTLVSEKTAVRFTQQDTLIHSTDTYAPCVDLTVQVLDGGKPAAGVPVRFQLVNYSECFSIYEAQTDEAGKAVFHTGMGGLRLELCTNGNLLTRQVDTRWETSVTLDLKDGKSPAALHGTVEAFDLAPPVEQVMPALPLPQQESHRLRLAACDAARSDYSRTFRQDLPHAKGNRPELEQFLADERFPPEEKQELLSTLRPKDWLDCTAEMLADTLCCAREYRERFDRETYLTCILAPRVANEMLLPVRCAIRSQIEEPFSDGRALLDWLRQQMRVADDDGQPALVPDCAKALYHKCINKSAFGVLFVTLCRTFGIPARQNPNTLAYEWLENGQFRRMDAPEEVTTVPLHLVNQSARPLPYGQRFTLGRLQQGRYETLCYDGLLLENTLTQKVPVGDYVLITTTRQIDGTVSTRMCYQTIRAETTLPVLPPEDQTARRIRQVPLPLPEGPIRDALGKTAGRRLVLFVEPGKEPTEHLLQEVLECTAACENYGLVLFADSQADLNNETLKRVLAALPHAVLLQADDPAGLQALRQAMGIGDERLPFALALDGQGRGLYASANYNIHTAQTLLNIQKLSEEKESV